MLLNALKGGEGNLNPKRLGKIGLPRRIEKFLN
jgi:hypothetical protein